MAVTSIFSSRIANFWPMQLRGPAENGTYAYMLRPSLSSSLNLNTGRRGVRSNMSDPCATGKGTPRALSRALSRAPTHARAHVHAHAHAHTPSSLFRPIPTPRALSFQDAPLGTEDVCVVAPDERVVVHGDDEHGDLHAARNDVALNDNVCTVHQQ